MRALDDQAFVDPTTYPLRLPVNLLASNRSMLRETEFVLPGEEQLFQLETHVSHPKRSGVLCTSKPFELVVYTSGYAISAWFYDGTKALLNFYSLNGSGFEKSLAFVASLIEAKPSRLRVESFFCTRFEAFSSDIKSLEIVRYGGDHATLVDRIPIPFRQLDGVDRNRPDRIARIRFETTLAFYLTDLDAEEALPVGIFSSDSHGQRAALKFGRKVINDPLIPFQVGTTGSPMAFPLDLPLAVSVSLRRNFRDGSRIHLFRRTTNKPEVSVDLDFTTFVRGYVVVTGDESRPIVHESFGETSESLKAAERSALRLLKSKSKMESDCRGSKQLKIRIIQANGSLDGPVIKEFCSD